VDKLDGLRHRWVWATIDMSRVPTIPFAVIAASFVALQVITTYVIPDIPDGLLWLMGISNGVYITEKVATQ